jgi:hypothetical protein
MTDSVKLARLATVVGRDLEERGYPAAAVLYQLSRALLDHPPSTPEGCPVCGGPVSQSGRGRPR